MNMKNCGPRNVMKHKDIKDSDKYITLDISPNHIFISKILFGKTSKGVD